MVKAGLVGEDVDFGNLPPADRAQVPETLFAQLREHLDEGQLVELTHHVALENLRGRFNVAFGVVAAGFSEGMVCAVPDSSSARSASCPARP